MSAPLALASHIHQVTVHTDGALVRRRAALPAGIERPALLRIEGLPLVAAGRPVRARVRDGAAEVLSCRLVAVAAAAEAGDQSLEHTLALATAAHEACERRVAVALARLRALSALAPPPRPDAIKGQAPPASPAAARFELLRFRDQEAERLGVVLATARREAEQAEEQQNQADAALRQATSARAARSGELRLAAELQLRWPDSGEPGWIELDYIVPGARWAPSYVLRFDRALGTVAIQLRGMVAQRSGEDWSGVRIACATAALQDWYELPALPGRRIGRAQSPPASGWRPAPSGAEALFADWDAFASRHPSPAEAEEGERVGRGGTVWSRDEPKDEDDEAMVSESVAEEVVEKRARSAIPMATLSAAAPPAPRMKSAAPAAGGAAMRDQKKSVRRSVAAPSNPVRETSAAYDEAAPEGGGGGGGGPDLPDEIGEPGADLLDFAALRLADAGEGRGRPRPGQRLSTDPRWLEARRAAVRVSAELASPPPGHHAVQPTSYTVRWEGDLPVTVPGDGGWHVVPLAAGASDVRVALVVVPRESRSAFRSAALNNPFDRGLNAGPADVYVGEDFLLSTKLPDIAPAAPASLGLGVEQALVVARNATFSEESAGLLGGSLHLRHAVRIALHNKAARPAAVEVRERLPQPDQQVEHCTVKQLKVEPPWHDWRPADAALPGGRQWSLTLAPGEQRELVYEYRVEIPAKNELVGGNRREA